MNNLAVSDDQFCQSRFWGPTMVHNVTDNGTVAQSGPDLERTPPVDQCYFTS